MSAYRHHVTGFFEQGEEARWALSRLVDRGLPRERLQLLKPDAVPRAAAPHGENNEVLKDVLVDGAIGTAVGTGIGALAEVALVSANVSLFVASSLVDPLAMLAWGAGLGGLIGAVVGAERHAPANDGSFAAQVCDAVMSGQTVLLAETSTPAETEIAREVIGETVADCRDVSIA
jgi:hypothetical protein